MITRFLAFILLLLNAQFLSAGVVRVRFVDQKQKALDKVNSKIVNLKNDEEATPTEYKKGLARFDDIPGGIYQLYAVLENHRKTKSEILTVTGKDLDLVIVLPEEKEFEKIESAGGSAFQGQNYAEARSQYERLLAWTPWDSGIATNLARTYILLGDPNKARALVAATVKYEAKETEKVEQEIAAGISFEEGRIALEKRDFARAIELMKENLKVEPDNADAFYALALAFGHQGNYSEALKNIDQAIALRPDDASFQQVKKLLDHNAEVSGAKK